MYAEVLAIGTHRQQHVQLQEAHKTSWCLLSLGNAVPSSSSHPPKFRFRRQVADRRSSRRSREQALVLDPPTFEHVSLQPLAQWALERERLARARPSTKQVVKWDHRLPTLPGSKIEWVSMTPIQGSMSSRRYAQIGFEQQLRCPVP